MAVTVRAAAPRSCEAAVAAEPSAALAAHTDSYFLKTKAIVGRFGDRPATYAVFMRRPVISAPRFAIEFLEGTAAARGEKFAIELSHPEGTWIGAGDPILYVTGKLPGLFAWPAGIGDVVVGLSAPLVALAYARNPIRNAGWVKAWNAFGILDLTVAVTTGFITSPSALFSYEPPNELITVFPLVLIPVYLVPLSILLHLASLKKLRRETAHTSTVATASARTSSASQVSVGLR